MGEILEIFGEDLEEDRRGIEASIAAREASYFKGSLTYRVELLSVFGLGHQGSLDFRAIETAGPETTELDKVLDYLNSEFAIPVLLSKDEVYLCRLVSMDAEGVKYVWSVNRLQFSDRWEITAWN